MAILNVNQTRNEMQKLKERLLIANRGHKLLKEKQDVLIVQFRELMEETNNQRMLVETMFHDISKQYILADLHSDFRVIDEIIGSESELVDIGITMNHHQGIVSPIFKSKQDKHNKTTSIVAIEPVFMDAIAEYQDQFLPALLQLATLEKRFYTIGSELKMLRRRVNALEYKTIPDLEETIKVIRNKIEDNERSTIARMTKI